MTTPIVILTNPREEGLLSILNLTKEGLTKKVNSLDDKMKEHRDEEGRVSSRKMIELTVETFSQEELVALFLCQARKG